MKARFTTPVRMLGLALLILACSPVTAPFSTFDLVGLLGGATAQSKKAPDEPAVELGGQVELAGTSHYRGRLLPCTVGTPVGFASLHRPLRI